MTSLDLLYSKTLLEDPRRTWEANPELFVDVALRTLLDREARSALLDALVERAGGRPPEPDDALAAQLAREGLVGVDPDMLVDIVADRDRLAGLCVCLETLEDEAGTPDAQEAAVASHDDKLDSQQTGQDQDQDQDLTLAAAPAVHRDDAPDDPDDPDDPVGDDADEDVSRTIAAAEPVSSDTIAEASPISRDGVLDSAQLRGFAGLGLFGRAKAATARGTLRGANPEGDDAADGAVETPADDTDDDTAEDADISVASDLSTATLLDAPAELRLPDADASEDDPDDPDLVHARDVDSVLFNLKSLAGPEKNPERAAAGQATEAAPGSGLLDLAAVASVRDKDLPDAPGRHEVWSAMVLPVPSLEGGRRNDRNLVKIGFAVMAVALVGLLATVIYLAMRDDTPPPAQNTVAAAEAGEEETPELGGAAAAGQGQVVAQNTAGDAPTGQEGTEPGAGVAGQPPVAGTPADATAAGSAAAPGSAGATPTDGAATTDAAADATAAAAATAEKKEDEKKSASRRSSRSDRKKSESKKSSSSLSKADVNKVIRGSFSKIRTCSRNAEVKGKLNIKFAIRGDGRVASASVASSEFKGTTVGACVVKVVEGMKFPAHGGDTVNVTYPFHIN